MGFRIRKWWRGLNVALTGFIGFMIGLLFPVLLNLMQEQAIEWTTTSLVVVIIILALALIYFAGRSYSRIDQLATSLEVSGKYFEEEYIDEVSYTGLIYRKMEELVSEAEKSVRALVVTRTGDTQDLTIKHPARAHYLRTLEDVITKRGNFTYIRIYQLPPNPTGQPLSEHLGAATSEHAKRILGLKQALASNQDYTLNVMTLPRQLHTSFIIIDDRKVVMDIYGVHKTGAYSRGLFILEDRGGKLIHKLDHYFEDAVHSAKPIVASDLD